MLGEISALLDIPDMTSITFDPRSTGFQPVEKTRPGWPCYTIP